MITLVGDSNKTAIVVFQLAENREKVPEMKHFCLLCKPSRKMLEVRQQLIPHLAERLLTDRLALSKAPHEQEKLTAMVNWGPQQSDGFQCMYGFFKLLC